MGEGCSLQSGNIATPIVTTKNEHGIAQTISRDSAQGPLPADAGDDHGGAAARREELGVRVEVRRLPGRDGNRRWQRGDLEPEQARSGAPLSLRRRRPFETETSRRRA